MFASICELLEVVAEDASNPESRVAADTTLEKVQTYDFVFCLMLMTEVLTFTNALSTALQKKGQDFVNACTLVTLVRMKFRSSETLDSTQSFRILVRSAISMG